MLEKTVSCKMCFQGIYAEATKRPEAVILDKGDAGKFEPLLTKINYLSEVGRLSLMLEAYDPLSTLTQEGGQPFPVTFDVGEDIVEVPFVFKNVS